MSTTESGAERIERAVRRSGAEGRLALAPFLTAGFPDPASFTGLLRDVGAEADVIEVGVPFSDPMADGVTIQRASERALAQGVTLRWILDALEAREPGPPIVLMSYLNPVLQLGLSEFAERARKAEVSGLIVPDLPFEECGPVREALDPVGLALIQLVTPETPPDRLRRLCGESRGFVYAVTMTGTTGASVDGGHDGVISYLDRVRAVSSLPVLAGFGIRTREDVAALEGHVDGVIVGSAVIEAIERGESPTVLLGQLRAPAHAEETS